MSQNESAMPSKHMESLEDHYRRSNTIASLDPPLSLEESRDVDDRWGDVTTEPGGVDYVEVDAGGVPALWATPKASAEDRVMLCLHGGGYVGGSMWTHRKLFAHLAKGAGVRALILDYRRTPEHQHPAPVDDATAAFAWLLDQGVAPEHVAFTGDSAGGGLTLSTVLRARERGLPAPAALLPFSPWVDMTFAGESLRSNLPTDILFGGERPMNLELLVQMFLGPDGDPRDPLASPLFADLAGMPPMYIQVSDAEMLLDDARRLHVRATEAGVESELDVFPGEQHTFQMAVGRSPQADEAVRRMAAWVRPRLGLPAHEGAAGLEWARRSVS